MFGRIITMIQELKVKGGPDVGKLITPNLKEIIRGDEELENKYAETIDMTEEQLIKNKNLEHLKVVRPLPQIQEEHKDIHLS